MARPFDSVVDLAIIHTHFSDYRKTCIQLYYLKNIIIKYCCYYKIILLSLDNIVKYVLQRDVINNGTETRWQTINFFYVTHGMNVQFYDFS